MVRSLRMERGIGLFADAGIGIRSRLMRPRADGQRQGQIKEPEAASAPSWMMCLKALTTRRSVQVQGAECNGCGKTDIGDRERPGSMLTRADGVRPCAGKPGNIGRSLARLLDSGHSRRATWKNRQGIDHAIRKLARRTARTVTGRPAWIGTGYLGPGGRVASAIHNSA